MVRELLESTACRLAAENMSKTEIDELNTILDADAALVSKGEAYYHTENTLDVHFCIVRGAHNSIIEALLCRELYPLIRMYRYQHKTVEGRASKARSEEHTSELQSLMRNPYAAFCLKNKTRPETQHT